MAFFSYSSHDNYHIFDNETEVRSSHLYLILMYIPQTKLPIYLTPDPSIYPLCIAEKPRPLDHPVTRASKISIICDKRKENYVILVLVTDHVQNQVIHLMPHEPSVITRPPPWQSWAQGHSNHHLFTCRRTACTIITQDT